MKSKKKVTQVQAILDELLRGSYVTGSSAYKITKVRCGLGTLNLHKIIATITKKGYKVKDRWKRNDDKATRYKEFYILKGDRKVIS